MCVYVAACVSTVSVGFIVIVVVVVVVILGGLRFSIYNGYCLSSLFYCCCFRTLFFFLFLFSIFRLRDYGNEIFLYCCCCRWYWWLWCCFLSSHMIFTIFAAINKHKKKVVVASSFLWCRTWFDRTIIVLYVSLEIEKNK